MTIRSTFDWRKQPPELDIATFKRSTAHLKAARESDSPFRKLDKVQGLRNYKKDVAENKETT